MSMLFQFMKSDSRQKWFTFTNKLNCVNLELVFNEEFLVKMADVQDCVNLNGRQTTKRSRDAILSQFISNHNLS